MCAKGGVLDVCGFVVRLDKLTWQPLLDGGRMSSHIIISIIIIIVIVIIIIIINNILLLYNIRTNVIKNCFGGIAVNCASFENAP